MDEGYSRFLYANRNYHADGGIHCCVYCSRRKQWRNRDSYTLEEDLVQSFLGIWCSGNVFLNIFYYDVLVHPHITFPRRRFPSAITKEVAFGTPGTLRLSSWHHLSFHISLHFHLQCGKGMASHGAWLSCLCSTYCSISLPA